MVEAAAPQEEERPKRGVGRGSRFFVLDRDLWERLWTVPTVNRLNLVTVFLVMLAGTGANHVLTKWSAKACEEHAGMGKPRAKLAIEELIQAGLASRTAESSRMAPQYRLAEPQSPAEPIFLPIQMVTGFGRDVSLLRRVRETGDPLLLRMLVDLYGLVQIDAAHGLPLDVLHTKGDSDDEARKVLEAGVHTLWAIGYGDNLHAKGAWSATHRIKGSNEFASWEPFWNRVRLLKKLGAIWFEQWVFEGPETDAEPMFPVDVGGHADDDVSNLTALVNQAAYELGEGRSYLLEQHGDRLIVALPGHHRPPALRGVARFRVEADTPGRRTAYALRKTRIEAATAAYEGLIENTRAGRFDRPMSAVTRSSAMAEVAP